MSGEPGLRPGAPTGGGAAADLDAVVERARGGDERAFAALVGHYGQAVLSLCYSSTLDRADAEELAQDVFVAAWRGLRRFRRDARFSTWLFAIARNACVDASRRRRARPRLAASADEPLVAAYDDHAARAAARAALRAAASLSLPLRQALLMRDVQGLAYDEIAALQNVPVGTVRSRIAAARRVVAEELGA